jgi:hypothetical protein
MITLVTTLPDFRSTASVAPISEVRGPAILLLPIIEIRKLRILDSFRWYKLHIKFNRNQSRGSKVETYGRRDTTSPI